MLVSPFFPMGINGKSYNTVMGKNGVGPPQDAFPQHSIGNAGYKEILIIIYLYKYIFGLAVVGG